MTILYVRSTDGSDADNGSTWALAKATLAGAIAAAAAGDTIYISQAHNEAAAGTLNASTHSSAAAPLKIICANDAAEPPTATATTGTVGGAGGITGYLYFYGLHITSASYMSTNDAGAGVQIYEKCVLTGNYPVFNFSGGATRLLDTDVVNNSTSYMFAYYGGFEWRGGSLSGPCVTVISTYNSTRALICGVDLSGMTGLTSLVSASGGSQVANNVVFRDCKLPASYSGALFGSTPDQGSRYEVHNTDSVGTNYRMWVQDAWGALTQETTVVRAGGASNGTTALSWKLTSTTAAAYPFGRFASTEIAAWNDDSGTAKTVTVEVITDGVTLTDKDCWLEVEYLGASTSPLGSRLSDAAAAPLATAANQAASTATWTTTGLASPVKQKLSVSLTPGMKGAIIARVVLAKPSTVVYVDPLLTVV